MITFTDSIAASLSGASHDQRDLAFSERLIHFYDLCLTTADQPTAIWSSLYVAYLGHLIKALQERDKARIATLLAGCHEFLIHAGMDTGEHDLVKNYTRELTALIEHLGMVPMQSFEQRVDMALSFTEAQRMVDGCGYDCHIEPRVGLPTVAIGGWQYHCSGNNYAYVISTACRFLRCRPEAIGSMLEVGPGLGLMGYFANRNHGIQYHTADLRLGSVIHAFVLHKQSGKPVWLHGDAGECCGFNIHGGCANLPASLRVRLAVNQNSLPEFSRPAATVALNRIAGALSYDGIFISINHESGRDGQLAVGSHIREHGIPLKLIARFPFWLWPGYVTEIFAKG